VITTIDVPGALGTAALGINNRGEIVGVYLSDRPHGFIMDRDGCTTLDGPGAAGTQLHGINDQGQIVGIFEDSGGTLHGLLLDGADATIIEAPGARPHTTAYDINERGQIVGFRDLSGDSLAADALPSVMGGS
jgi:uncharacterized membrane protein